MGEEAGRGEFGELVGRDDDDEVNGGRVMEWEIGLPSADELTPLSQPLVPPDLAYAFSISPEPARTILDVHRASQTTLSSLLPRPNPNPNPNTSPGLSPSPRPFSDDTMPGQPENQEPETSADDQSGRALKRQRLMWTPQLHKRFVDVVAHLGIKNAVPKTIMQLMNVEGLTRENVASHLQKYRLYLKRMQGLSNDGPSPSDQLFSSTPVPQSLQQEALPPVHQQQQQQQQLVSMPYAMPTMIPMPMYHGGHNGHIGMVPMNNSYQHYGGFAEQGDWPMGGSKFGSVASYPPALPRVTHNDK